MSTKCFGGGTVSAAVQNAYGWLGWGHQGNASRLL